MSASKDPTFKLFGTAIPVSDLGKESDPEGSPEPHEKDTHRDATHAEVESQMAVQTGLSNNWNFSSALKGNKDVNPQNPRSHGNLQGNDQDQDSKEVVDHRAPHQESKQIVDPKPEEDLTETDESGQEKALKKPDKMLPCPRCNSLDTKFCYFNNYNVNQPRHFCKNCHRYWTAGGNMRNVPVGAGRRKNKHAASHYRQLMMSSDVISNTTVDAPHASHHQVLTCGLSAPLRPVNCDPTVLKFGSDAPLCKSVENTLNLHDQKKNIDTDHVPHGKNGGEPHGKNGGEPSCGSSLTASNSLGTELPEHRDQIESGGLPGSYNGVILPHPMQCYGGPSWPHPWYPGWNNVAAMAAGGCSSELVYGPGNRSLNPVHWGPRPMMAPPPAFCAPNVPFPYVPVPASSWGWVPGWAGGPWKFPCALPLGGVSSTSSSSSGCSGNDSLTPGKHSRDGNLLGEEKLENCPETLKIPRTVDADEAAKSSIWVTLGRKTDQSESVSKGGINKPFQSKLEDDDHSSDASQVLQANPAALSRSQTFQESSI